MKAGVETPKPCPPCPPTGQPRGGSYKGLRAEYKGQGKTTEVHHMPADAASDLKTGDGPAIAMEKLDHRKTASFDNREGAAAYRDAQEGLIKEGKFREAMQMDISDIQSKFGSKYDAAISEAVDYAKSIGRW